MEIQIYDPNTYNFCRKCNFAIEKSDVYVKFFLKKNNSFTVLEENTVSDQVIFKF
jgi:hypothetical protein